MPWENHNVWGEMLKLLEKNNFNNKFIFIFTVLLDEIFPSLRRPSK